MADFSLDRVAGALNARGIAAVVDHTGGGTATLFAGVRFFDRDGEPRWQAMAGPGWFDGPGMYGNAMASTDEFSVGPDDNGDSAPDDDMYGRDYSGKAQSAIELEATDAIALSIKHFEWPDGAYQRTDGHWGDHDILADDRKRSRARRQGVAGQLRKVV